MKDHFVKYLAEKGIEPDALKEKSAEELAGIYNEYNEKVREELASSLEAKASKEDIEALQDTIRANQIEQQKQLNEALKDIGLAIKKSQRTPEKASEKSFKEQINEQADKLEGLKDADKFKGQRIAIKAPATMLLSTNVTGGNLPVEQRLAGLNIVPSRRVRLFDIVKPGSTTGNLISWVYQANLDGAAGGTNEGAPKNQIDFDFVIDSEYIRKRTAYIKVSEEALEDVDMMDTEIRNHLIRELLKDAESQVYGGDGVGTGLNGNLRGIVTVASAFSAGSQAGLVDNANLVDVLRVSKTQILLADQEMPNYILLNPEDVLALQLIKVTTTDKRYIDALQVVAGQLFLDGIPIIETTLVPQDEFVIGNFDLATVYNKGDIRIEVGRDGNDFTNNLVTILAEWRGACVVKNNDRGAFVSGSISAAAALLETP